MAPESDEKTSTPKHHSAPWLQGIAELRQDGLNPPPKTQQTAPKTQQATTDKPRQTQAKTKIQLSHIARTPHNPVTYEGRDLKDLVIHRLLAVDGEL